LAILRRQPAFFSPSRDFARRRSFPARNRLTRLRSVVQSRSPKMHWRATSPVKPPARRRRIAKWLRRPRRPGRCWIAAGRIRRDGIAHEKFLGRRGLARHAALRHSGIHVSPTAIVSAQPARLEQRGYEESRSGRLNRCSPILGITMMMMIIGTMVVTTRPGRRACY
jgi:hypothetical protein